MISGTLLSLCLSLISMPVWDRDMSGSVSLNDLQQRYQLSLEVDAVTGRRVLRSATLTVALTPGLDAVTINGQFQRLSREVTLRERDVLVPIEVLTCIEDRLSPKSVVAPVQSNPSSVRPMKIVIDPGHGGDHTGGEGHKGLLEKNVNLDVALKLKDRLEEAGLTVVMTRTTDRHLSPNVKEDLERRVEVANREHPDLFISIHSNWHRTSSPRGFEIFTARDEEGHVKDEKMRDFTRDELRSVLGVNPPLDPQSQRALQDILLDEYRKATKGIAQDIRHNFASDLDTEDRGVKEAGYYVIKWVRCPAVLVEMEFISNTRGERDLGDPQYRKKLADLLARSIMNYSKKREQWITLSRD